MSVAHVLLVEDSTFQHAAPLAIHHIKIALEAEGCQVDLVRETDELTFLPSKFDVMARQNLQNLVRAPSIINIAAGSRAQRILKQVGKDFRSWSPNAEVEPGLPMPLLGTPRSVQHPPQALGICSKDATTQRAAQLVAEELDLLLIDLSDHAPQADISLAPNFHRQPHLHALDLILCDRPDIELPAIEAALCGVAIVGPGVCNDEPFDSSAVDAWRSKSRQLLEDRDLRRSHAQAWCTWLSKRHDPKTIAQGLLGGLPLLQPKMN